MEIPVIVSVVKPFTMNGSKGELDEAIEEFNDAATKLSECAAKIISFSGVSVREPDIAINIQASLDNVHWFDTKFILEKNRLVDVKNE